jgi:hypothetical protein
VRWPTSERSRSRRRRRTPTLLVLEVHVPELTQGHSLNEALRELRPSLVARTAPGVSLLIYAAMPVLYFLSITVLRSGRKRNREYADFT